MSTLSASDITALLARGGYKRKRNASTTGSSNNYHYVRDPQGIMVKVDGKPSAARIGKFEGKVGTTVRSRKGRTYHAPNGSRNYIAPYDSEVVMYDSGRVVK